MNTISTKEDPLPIYRLDIPSIINTISDQDKTRLTVMPFYEKIKFLIEAMIGRANELNRTSIPKSTHNDIEQYADYTLFTEERKYGAGFSRVVFTRAVESISDHLANLMIANPQGPKLSSRRIETIGFLFREQLAFQDLYALGLQMPSKVIAPYIDTSFPQSIARRILDPKVRKIEYRSLAGNTRRIEKEYPASHTLLASQFFDKQIIKTTSDVLQSASIFKLTCFQTPQGKIPKVLPTATVDAKSVLFNKQLKPDEYPLLLDHLSTIHHEQIVLRPNLFSHTSLLTQANNQERLQLENLLTIRIWNILCYIECDSLTFSHDTADWTASHTCTLLRNNQQLVSWDGLLSAFNVLQLLRQHLPPLASYQDLERELATIQYSFKVNEKSTVCSLKEMLCGEFRIPETQKPFLLIHGKWFALSSNYVQDLHNEFSALLRESLITETDSTYALLNAWPTDSETIIETGQKSQRKLSEKAFNQRFINERLFLFGDQVLVEDHIEFFDLQKVTPSGCIWYFVKKGYGQHTRDATSQMRISAALVHEMRLAANSNDYSRVDTLCDKLEKRMPNCFERIGGKETYKNILLNRPITFVYALFEDNLNHLQLTQDAAKKDLLSAEDFPEYTQCPISTLKQLGFLTYEGYITPKMRHITQTEFTHSLQGFSQTSAKAIYNKIAQLCLLSHNTLIAPFELLQLARKLKKYNIDFKIDLISSKKKLDPTQIEVPTNKTFPLNGQSYVVRETARDASSAFHAIFGVFNNNRVALTYSVEYPRKHYCERLEEILNTPTKHPYGQMVVQSFQSLIRNMLFFLDTTQDNVKKFLLAAASKGVYYKSTQTYHTQRLATEEQNLFNAYSKILTGDSSQKIKQDLNALTGNDASYNAFKRSQTAIEQYLLTLEAQKYSKPKEIITERNKHLHSLYALYQELASDQTIRAAYLHCLEDVDYWLNNEELALMSTCYEIGLDIVSASHELTAFPDYRDKKVLFRVGNYYFACERL